MKETISEFLFKCDVPKCPTTDRLHSKKLTAIGIPPAWSKVQVEHDRGSNNRHFCPNCTENFLKDFIG